MTRYEPRTDAILELFKHQPSLQAGEVARLLHGRASLVTVRRDLQRLVSEGALSIEGGGRATRYVLAPQERILRAIDAERYFEEEPDARSGKTGFDHGLFREIGVLFTPVELEKLREGNARYLENVTRLPEAIRRREMERLVIELSWKSSRIEGNTYSLLETETLLKESQEAPGHLHAEAVMILNHKKTFEHVIAHAGAFRECAPGRVEAIHELLTDGLGIARGLRSAPVGISGTSYVPLDNRLQLGEALAEACAAIDRAGDPFSKALLANALIPYVQPFEDGNKRTGRLLGNALLLAHDHCPLSYRSVNETEYKKALILLYEQGSIAYLKEIFIEQFDFAVGHYFRA